MIKPALIFQDHMVLQRDKKIPIWGIADSHSQITVSMQGKTAYATADTDGNWQVTCGPFCTSFEEKLTITSTEGALTLCDIQVGEVWLAGGQSNMEFHMRYDADVKAEKEICTNNNIRFFDYPEVSYVGQIDEADYGANYGFWRKAVPDQLERFSAVAYYFAKDIQQKYSIPVGIIGCNWGGSPACAWMSREAIAVGGGQIWLDEYDTAIKDLDLSAYDEMFKNDPMGWRVDQLANPIEDILMIGGTEEDINAKFMALGITPASLDSSAFVPVVGPKASRRPAGLFESMLKPIVPYGIRGVIWYQGETDGDTHPEVYQALFPALIQDWRKLWNEELPFLFVQIAPLDNWGISNGAPYVEVRAAQQHTADTVPGTGMAVITDVGMKFDIHPKKKQPVGHRLALLAEGKVYGDDVLCEAPALSGISVQAGQLILTFKHTGDGLYLADTAPYGQRLDGQKLGGLQVFQNGQELDASSLYARAEGNQVVVFGENICAGVPTQVKLAETGWYQVNLYNSADIPARPAHIWA